MNRTAAVFLSCLLATSAACGGKSSDGEAAFEPTEPPEPTSMPAPQPMTPITPDPPSADEDLLARVAGPTPPGRTVEELMMNEEVRYQGARAAFLGVLAEHCGACHGRPSGTDSSAERGPLGFTDDLERMVELGVIVPYDAAGSEVVNAMLDGSMPPPDVARRPSETEIEAVRRFIDWPFNWQSSPPL